MSKKQKWTGLVCPTCRFVIRVPAGASGQAAICPACDRLFNISQGDSKKASSPILVKEDDDEYQADYEVNGKAGVKGKASGRKPLLLLGVAVILLAVIGSFFWGSFSKAGKDSSGEITPTVVVEKTTDKAADQALEDAQYEQVVQTVRKFLSNEEVSTIGSMVRNPEVAIPRIDAHYKKHSWEATNVIANDIKVSFDSGSSFVGVRVVDGRPTNNRMTLEKIGGEYLVDWESWVAWSEMEWESLLVKRPSEEKLVRIHCSEAEYYAGEYADDEKWLCLKLKHISSDGFVYGYVTRDLFSGAGLANLLLSEGKLKLTLKVKYPQNLTTQNQLLVTEVMYLGWVDMKDVDAE